MTTNPPRIDVRTIPPGERHPMIFSTFAALAPGECMELVNDHDPMPLYHQFRARMPGQFRWLYLEEGPQTWRVSIERVSPVPAASGSCCGSCGGA